MDQLTAKISKDNVNSGRKVDTQVRSYNLSKTSTPSKLEEVADRNTQYIQYYYTTPVSQNYKYSKDVLYPVVVQ